MFKTSRLMGLFWSLEVCLFRGESIWLGFNEVLRLDKLVEGEVLDENNCIGF